MNIRIESLSVNGLGPIANKEMEFKDINLIYGKNERGKTYLVEYLLSSLFKGYKAAKKSRQLTESGQVFLSGINDKSSVFHPKAKKKVEDYLFTGDDKSIDLYRLCVVKGGVLSFLTGGEEPLTKAILKDYLSDQGILNMIEKGIPETIKASSWESGDIVIYGGRQPNEIKEYYAHKAAIENIDSIINEFDQAYSLGEVKRLENEFTKITQLIEDQEKARRAHAYSLWQQIQETDVELNKIPEKELERVEQLLGNINRNNDLIKENQIEISTLEDKCKHYDWLNKAILGCEKRPEALTGRLIWIFMSLVIICTLATIVFAFLAWPYYSLVAGLLAILSLLMAFFQYRKRLMFNTDRVEVEGIFQEYEMKFGEKAKSISTLINTRDLLTKEKGKLESLREQVKRFQEGLSRDREEMWSKLEELTRMKVGQKKPAVVISRLKNQRAQLRNKLVKSQSELDYLGVLKGEYIQEPVGSKYSSKLLESYQKSKKNLEERKSEINSKLTHLKDRVANITHDDPTTIEWDALLDHLRDVREAVVIKKKQVKAQIGSGIVISQVIDEKREREDATISEALASPLIVKPIKALTHNYDGIEIEGDEIIVCNKVKRYPLHQLSTGAQEQVLLALRIGIASQILNDRKMFLILDDAFQHSDWERREWLVDEMGTLANLGWQIIYFSMDDHIKSLFEERIKPNFKDRYQTFELNT